MIASRIGAVSRRARRGVANLARKLPPPRDEAALALLRSARDVLYGRTPSTPMSEHPSTAAYLDGSLIGPPLPKVAPVRSDATWTAPPEVPGTGKVIDTVYDAGDGAIRYDVDLLEQLNAEYAAKRIVPNPRKYTAAALSSGAEQRLLWAHGMVDLQDKTVLEIGCGHGFEVWWLAHNLGCDAYGVDVRELGTWAGLRSDRVSYVMSDMAVDSPFPNDMFDRIISYTVWEHVAHPYELLQQAFNVLKPGGLAWIHANLYAGPQASHRYRDIYFPWPHLLFSDDVIREWDVKHGRKPTGSAWVNRLTWDHYFRYFQQIGFRIRHLKFWEATWDQEFYERFEDVLGRFPKEDLIRDYFVVVLEKPA